MATAFSSFQTPIVSSAALPNRKNRVVVAQSNNWWAPLFGFSSEPDYINNGAKNEADQVVEGESGQIGPEKKLFRGCLTAEKAKELRKKTIESSNFHDIMYHSSIAARLASDVSGR